METSGTPLKPSGQEQHARLNAKLFELCSVPASQAFCLRGRDRAKLKKLSIEPGVLLLATCLHQGSDKDKEEEKPRDADEEGGGTPLRPSGQD